MSDFIFCPNCDACMGKFCMDVTCPVCGEPMYDLDFDDYEDEE